MEPTHDAESLSLGLAADRVANLSALLIREIRQKPTSLQEFEKLLGMLDRETATLREMIEQQQVLQNEPGIKE